MKFLILFTLFVSQLPAARADLICRTPYIGSDRRQFSVYLYQQASSRAVFTTTSNRGLFAPTVFNQLRASSNNTAVTYTTETKALPGGARFSFQLVLKSKSSGVLILDQETIPVACVSSQEPILSM